jgi:hypothetical protein
LVDSAIAPVILAHSAVKAATVAAAAEAAASKA